MGLTSTPLLVLVIVATVAAPIVLGLSWRRAVQSGRRRTGFLATLGRFLAVLGCQVLAVFLTFLVVNNSYSFYTSWSDLFGFGTGSKAKIKVQGLITAEQGQLKVVDVHGGPSGVRQSILIWLPPQYDEAEYADHDFGVLMVLPGQPSGVETMFSHFRFGQVATDAIASGRVKPFIAVFPPLMTNPPRDTECTDVQNGPQALTWLTDDVRAATINSVRASSDPASWSVTGWSTGGFCAAKLVLRDPGGFTNAAALGAYYEPITDSTTGRLFGTSKVRRDENSPLKLYQQSGLAGGHSLLIVSGRQDQESWRSSEKMITATVGDRHVYTLVFATGGHNYRNYTDYLGDVLEWFDQRGAFG